MNLGSRLSKKLSMLAKGTKSDQLSNYYSFLYSLLWFLYLLVRFINLFTNIGYGKSERTGL